MYLILKSKGKLLHAYQIDYKERRKGNYPYPYLITLYVY
jgi:hypothetical protein